MIDSHADPRTEDVLTYDLLRTVSGGEPQAIGRAVFRDGRSSIEAPEDVRTAVSELLARAFVDRVQADERPRGYRRTGRGSVDMLVPGMAEHFIARLRGLWLPYPDGSVVTARASAGASLPAVQEPASTEVGPPVTDSSVRRATLATADETLNVRPLVRAHPPETGMRPMDATSSDQPLGRSDCGWLV